MRPLEDKKILLSLKHVDISFGKSKGKVVKDATFDIYQGETFSLVGESGSGKTTIGRAIIRVNPCAAGEILYKGQRISGDACISVWLYGRRLHPQAPQLC